MKAFDLEALNPDSPSFDPTLVQTHVGEFCDTSSHRPVHNQATLPVDRDVLRAAYEATKAFVKTGLVVAEDLKPLRQSGGYGSIDVLAVSMFRGGGMRLDPMNNSCIHTGPPVMVIRGWSGNQARNREETAIIKVPLEVQS